MTIFAAIGQASTPATGPAVPTAEHVSHFLTIIIALGLFVLGAVVLRAFARPETLRLAGTPARENRVNVLHLLLVLLPWLILMMMVIDLIIGWRLGVDLKHIYETEPAGQFTLQVIAFKSMVVPLWMIGASLWVGATAFRHGIVRGMGLSLRHWFCDGLRAVIAFFALMPVCVGLLLLATWLASLRHFSVPSHPLLEAFKDLPTWWKVGAFVAAAVLAPISEELFFRGVFQSFLRGSIGKPWPAILITSFFFASLHAPQTTALPSLFVLAVVLGFLYEKSGRLIAPMIVHSLFNAVNMISTLSN